MSKAEVRYFYLMALIFFINTIDVNVKCVRVTEDSLKFARAVSVNGKTVLRIYIKVDAAAV